MLVFVNYIIGGCSIRISTKIKLMGAIIYKVTNGNIMKFYMRRRIMGCYKMTQNGGLGWL